MKDGGNQKRGRPVVITIICVIVFAALLVGLRAIPDSARTLGDAYGAWYSPFWVMSLIVTCLSMVGYWRMRRWGVYLYTTLFAVSSLIGLVTDVPFTVTSTLGPLFVIIVGFRYFGRMS